MPFTRASEEERDKIIKEILLELPHRESKIDEGLRVVVTGKGGAGKTVLASLLSYRFAEAGYRVLAVDEDPQMNLSMSLGLPEEVTNKIVPLNRQLDYIEEKTGARPGTGWGLFIRLNPNVEDVVERFGIKISERLTLLVMGTVVQAAVGCTCPENDLLAAVMNYISLQGNEVIVMDTEAGLEQFGRAISRGFHRSLIISEPTSTSMDVSIRAAELSRDLKIPYVHLIVNKVRSEKEEQKVLRILDSSGKGLFHSIVFLPYSEDIYRNEPSVLPMFSHRNTEFMQKFEEAFKRIFENWLIQNNRP
ncbi:MAG: AAA family ATPase [Candidatus Bathyarchaeia archaeon]